jgi:LysM repeat protein
VDTSQKSTTQYQARGGVDDWASHPVGVKYAAVRKPPRRLPFIMISVFFMGLCLLPFTVAVGFYGYLQIFERIVPNVHVGEIDLTWMRISEAAAEINTHYNLEKKIELTDGINTWSVFPSELGLSVAGYATAQSAYQVGRFNSASENIEQMVTSFRQGWQIEPEVNLDPDVARAELVTLNSLVRKPPQNATVTLVGEILQPVPGELGYEINIEETLNNLMSDPSSVITSGRLSVQLKPLLPEINDVSSVLADAEKILDAQHILLAYDPVTDETIKITISKDILGTWLTGSSGTDGTQIGIDETMVAAYLSSQSETLGNGRWLDASKFSHEVAQAIVNDTSPTIVVNHLPTTYKVQKGDTLLKISWKLGFPMWKLIEANPDLDPEKLYSGQVMQVPSKDDLLPLPVVPNKRIVISISKQRLMVYENGKQIHKYIISTGIDRSPTQPGIFQVQTHKTNAYASVWDLTMPNFLGIYEAWPGFMNGIHGLPMLSNGVRLWANILGKPASFGCIILDLPESKNLYKWADNGVVVEIRP